MLEGVRRFNKGRPLQGPWGLAHGVNAGGDGAGGRSKAELTETQRETELS